MSFTLRTLLAFLDHAPLPTEEREPIQRALDQNPAAQELVQRIRTLMAQPRMASPAVETAGVLQANQVAEYLDGTSELETTKKYEQTCLKNDAALSEIAALHQILTDWIDQPTFISEELRQRIYQFAGSWADTPAFDEETQTPREAGRDAIQAAAQLLQVREIESPIQTQPSGPVATSIPTTSIPATSIPATSIPATSIPTRNTAERNVAPIASANRSLPESSLAAAIKPKNQSIPPSVPGSQATKVTIPPSADTEESANGSWILALLVLVGCGFLWWSQQSPAPLAGLALDVPLSDPVEPETSASVGQSGGVTPLQLPQLPSPGSAENSIVSQTAPSASLPPIHMSSGSTLPPISLGSPGHSDTPPRMDLELPPTSAALEIPTLPAPALESSTTQLENHTNLIPGFAEPSPIAAEAITPKEPDAQDAVVQDAVVQDVNTSDASLPSLGAGNMAAFPLAELQPTELQPTEPQPTEPQPTEVTAKPTPNISSLPPIEEFETSDPSGTEANGTNSMGVAPAAPTALTNLPSSIANPTTPSPLVPSPLAPSPTTSVPPASSPLAPASSPLAPAPIAGVPATSPALPPLEWGAQIGTVVMEAAAGESQDDWIVVLPGGRSQLQVRSPRGKAWNFAFSGVSRYQLQESHGLPQLSVQRCFMLLQCNCPDETLEIQTPKGKVWVTALTPDAELIFEIRPFLPQGMTATAAAPRYYLGCLGISGRAIVEHQEQEHVLFANKWMVVKPDGEQKSYDDLIPEAIARTVQELKDNLTNPDVTALSGLVQSDAGIDELLSMATGSHIHSQSITTDQRSLAAMWGYCLGQLDPAFSILNDPTYKDYWDAHIQAIASCLQSDPTASQQLETAATRFGFSNPIATRFVGLNPQTTKMSQVSELVSDLEHAQVARRVLALYSLKRLTNETYGYDPTSSTDLNRDAIIRWKQWLADSATSRISINPTSELTPRNQQ